MNDLQLLDTQELIPGSQSQVDKAFAIADVASYELILSSCVSLGFFQEGDVRRYAMTDENCSEVNSIMQAEDSQVEAFLWLKSRGLAQLKSDKAGDYIELLPLPEELTPAPLIRDAE